MEKHIKERLDGIIAGLTIGMLIGFMFGVVYGLFVASVELLGVVK